MARQLSAATICVALVATPATVGLSLAKLTGNTDYRPFALNADDLGTTVDTGALLQAHLHVSPTGTTQAEAIAMGRAIQAAFQAKGHSARIVIVPAVDATDSYVMLHVGHNVIGPFEPSASAHAITPAVTTMRSFKKPVAQDP